MDGKQNIEFAEAKGEKKMGYAKVTKNQPVTMKVMNLRKADKKENSVAFEATFKDGGKVYNYCRPIQESKYPGCKSFVADGIRVHFEEGSYVIAKMEREYDTEGFHKKTSSKIKAEIEKQAKEKEEKKAVENTQEEKKDDFPTDPDEIRHEKYEMIKTCLQANIPVYLAGPAGSGKNHTIEQIADELGWAFYFANSIQDEFKLTGFNDAGGNYHETEFYKACTSDVDCIFFLDELDASIPEVLVLLNAAIANGYFNFPNGRVELKKVHFVAAGNTVGNGADEAYTGRMVIDQATLDRFAIIEFGYSLRIEMGITKNNADLVNFIHQLREEAESKAVRTTFSYRGMKRVCKLEKTGMDLVTILTISLFGGLDKDTINTLHPFGDTKYHKALKEIQMAA